jgi:hypothetical protein
MVATVLNVAVVCSWTVAPKLSAAAGAMMLVARFTGQILESGEWGVVTAEPVDGGNVLNQAIKTVKAAEPW